MKKIVTLLLLLLPLLFLYADVDHEMATLYTQEAQYYYDEQNYSLADTYIANALEFSSDLPETWYLAGLIREEQGDRLKAIEQFRKSINLTGVYTDYYYDLYSRYLNLLNITASYDSVLSFFKEKREIFEKDPQILLKVSDAAFRNGLLDYSRQLASEVYMRNPYNLKALLYLMRVDKSTIYKEKISMALHRIEKDPKDEVVFQQLIIGSEKSSKESLLELYRKIFGETDFYSLETDGNSETINKSRNLMIRSYGDDVLEDGVYFGDYNFDGISDEIVSVTGDQMTYLRDTNQDNITDISLKFNKGKPVNIYINKGKRGFEFSYSDFPYLDSVDLFRDDIKRTYKVYPGTEYSPIENLDDFSWKYNRNRAVSVESFDLTEPDLVDISYLMTEYTPGSEQPFREYSFLNGELIGIREDLSGNGKYNYFLDIKAWLPEAGRLDLNEDGIIDFFEYYEDGKKSGIAIDWNNNGKPEYIEDWSVLPIKSWDFDEDFSPDAEYIESSNGSIYFNTPAGGDLSLQNDLYSWDFTYENFWFSNN